MSFRDWMPHTEAGRVIPALALLALAGGYGLASCDLSRVIERQDKAHGVQRDTELWAPIPFDRGPISKPYTARCDQPKDREEADLCQQWRAADAAEKSAGVAEGQTLWNWVQAVAALVSAYAAWAAAKAAKAAKDSVKVAQDTAKRQLRAYISVEGGGVIATRDGNSWIIRYSVTLKNSGQTPGYDFSTLQRAGWYSIVEGKKPHIPLDMEMVRAKSILGPGSDAHVGSEFRVAEVVVEGFRKKSWQLIIKGRADFLDVFDERRYFEWESCLGDMVGQDQWSLMPAEAGYKAN